MKKRVSKIIIRKSFIFTAFLCVILTGLTFLFTSCENFMKATATKQELEQALNYANSDSYTIKIDYPVGTGVLKYPAGGIVEKKVTDVFNITFEPFTDYAFVCWKITDSITGKEIKNGEYLNIENTGLSDTKCTFTNSPAPGIKLCLNAVVAERPQIISYSPSSTDIMRDCSIQVLFDRDMDPYSIYYTDQEIADLQKESNITLLKTTLNDGSSVVYGYNKDGNVVFKNISITNKKTKENLTGYYDAPTMEDGLLTIPANRANPPEGYSQILVTLSKGFYYSLEDTNQTNANGVELAGSKKWMYQVNNSTDTQKMKIKKGKDSNGNTIDLFIVKLGSTELKESYLSNPFEAEEDNVHIRKNTLKTLQPQINDMFFCDKNTDSSKISIYLSLEDGMGSGPKPNFNVKLQKVANADYTLNPENTSTIFEVTQDYLNVSSQEAFFDGEFDLGNLLKVDGVYLLTVTCEDKSNNPLKKSYLFARDTKRPVNKGVEKIVLSEYNWGSLEVAFAWKKEDYDIEEIAFRYKRSNGDEGVDYDYNSPYIKEVLLDGVEYYMRSLNNYGLTTSYTCWIEYTEYTGEVIVSDTVKLNGDAISSYIHLPNNDIYSFGNYPQSECTLTNEEKEKLRKVPIYDYISQADLSSDNKNYTLWHDDWYLGPDGYYYQEYKNKYYKIEPIKWKMYKESGSPYYKSFVSTKILSGGFYTQESPFGMDKIFTQLGKSRIKQDDKIEYLLKTDFDSYNLRTLKPVETDYALVIGANFSTYMKNYWWIASGGRVDSSGEYLSNPTSNSTYGYVPKLDFYP